MKKNDKVEFVPNFESKCEYCLWYQGNRTCAAFQDSIPENIWKGTHDKVEEGQDLDITFKPEGDIL